MPLANLLDNKCPLQEGIYFCLDTNVVQDEIKKTEIATYSDRASNFDEKMMLSLSDEHKNILKPLTSLPMGSTILELGCGDGRFAFYLLRKGYNVIASDISLGTIRKIKEVAQKNQVSGGVYAVIDAENLPFDNNSLDAVYLVACLHHLPDAKKAVDEMARVLKTNGRLLILREPAAWQYLIFGPVYKMLKKIIRQKNNQPFSLADDKTHGFSKKTLTELLTGDFKLIDFKPVHYTRKIYDNFLILISKLTSRVLKKSESLRKFLKFVDAGISKVPIIRGLTWDWDVYCTKK